MIELTNIQLYCIITYLIGVGAALVDINNNDFDYIDFILLLLAPIIVPIALGVYLNTRHH